MRSTGSFGSRPPLLLPPTDTTSTQQQQATIGRQLRSQPPPNFRPGPLTPGMPSSVTNEEADGVVPYTPTLLPQRQLNDDGYYPSISSPRVPPQQINRFRFEPADVLSTAAPAVPGGNTNLESVVASVEFGVDSAAVAGSSTGVVVEQQIA